jgi:hypothetical protein
VLPATHPPEGNPLSVILVAELLAPWQLQPVVLNPVTPPLDELVLK